MKFTPTGRVVTEYRTREKNLLHFFKKKEHGVGYIDVNGLMKFMNISNDSNNWKFFIDSSKLSLKVVLLHEDNLLPSIPIGHSVHEKETDANVKLLLELIKYEDHEWQICGHSRAGFVELGRYMVKSVKIVGTAKFCSLKRFKGTHIFSPVFSFKWLSSKQLDTKKPFLSGNHVVYIDASNSRKETISVVVMGLEIGTHYL
ncbi:uncharacterized protein TNIN_131441 [Trichonephila inaurata madagascariensis]|uniref:Uncharacterized protein n=1 Tax=Trichonephila inaurata madagascariensis TaxID=2747483 RepID=A0A8X6YPS0_9ARAC|nr:uncharacterized protein TNIN_131441 [Trichonephila inaurata madagascariensis]